MARIRIMLCAVSMFIAATASSQTSLRLLSSVNAPNAAVPELEIPFTKGIVDASKGEIKIQRSGPEVVPTFEQLQPLSAGVFDLLFTVPGYHQAASGVGTLLDSIKADTEARRTTGLFQWLDDFYKRRFGVRVIAIMPFGRYQFLLREPIGADGMLTGRKLRSTAAYDGLIRQLGGIPVALPTPETYPSMQKGVIDGAAFVAGIAADFKMHEVAKYMARPLFGNTTVILLANAKKFESLPVHLQKIILDEGRKIEQRGESVSENLVKQDTEKMQKGGAQISNFSPAMAAKVVQGFNEGVLATALKSMPEDVKAFWEFARGKNMLEQ